MSQLLFVGASELAWESDREPFYTTSSDAMVCVAPGLSRNQFSILQHLHS